jgi:hypothetical protein
MRKYLLGILMGLLCASGALALHGHWISHYTDASGVPCCGMHDCVKTSMRVLHADKTTLVLEISGAFLVHIPQGSFFPSEDDSDWWCALDPAKPPSTANTRCAFLAVGS